MGSMWCKPAEFRDDCSPKINIQSILSRLRGQVCPSRCRYPQTSTRPRAKPRPRNLAVSNGGRPVISPPLQHPVPPPRKKRRCHLQEMSRSEEELSSAAAASARLTTLRTANSLPVLCVPIIQLRPDHDELPSIREEPIYTPINEPEELESIPIGEVYFLRKEEKIPNFEAVSKDVADKIAPAVDSPSDTVDMANSNFLDRSVRPGQTRIKTETIERVTDERKQIVETETILSSRIKQVVQKGSRIKVQEDKKRRSETSSDTARRSVTAANEVVVVSGRESEGDTKEQPDEESRVYENVEVVKKTDAEVPDAPPPMAADKKKSLDAVKSKWLQNILIGSDPSGENHSVNTGFAPTTFVPDDLQNSEKRELMKPRQKETTKLIIEPQETTEPKLKNNVLENSTTDEKHHDQSTCQLIVTPENLTDSLQRLNSPKLIRDVIYNTRNLVYSSQIAKDAENLSNPEVEAPTKTENNKTDSFKLGPHTDLHHIHHQQHSRKSSRHSSITDSLQEFESSIYDMLQESAKGNNGSDDEDSFVLVHKNNASTTNRQEATASS